MLVWFTSRCVQARSYVSVRSGYDLCHPSKQSVTLRQHFNQLTWIAQPAELKQFVCSYCSKTMTKIFAAIFFLLVALLTDLWCILNVVFLFYVVVYQSVLLSLSPVCTHIPLKLCFFTSWSSDWCYGALASYLSLSTWSVHWLRHH